MIDGYSVEEAASVLGVPEGRVWELLARGVLSGTPEGDSMRVFLKAQAGPIANAGAGSGAESPRTNGNGGSHAATGEASAFRELLTEFRNLTERYGQALLALGESRGEVAGLRSRVDLLEARLDLRLPPARDEVSIAWEAPSPLPPAEVPVSEPVAAPAAEPPAAEPPAPRTSRARKARTSRAAVAGFAEALARAQDPAAAEVRPAPAPAVAELGADDAAAAPDDAEPVVEALQQAFEVTAPDAAPAVSREAQATEEAPPESPYSADVVEPDWFADGDFAWLDVAELEARTTPAVADAEPEPSAVAVAEAEVDVAPPPVDVAPPPVDVAPPPIDARPEPAVDVAQPPIDARPEPAVAAPSGPAEVAEVAPEVASEASETAASSAVDPEAEIASEAASEGFEAPVSSAVDPEAEPAPAGPTTLQAVAMDAEPRPEADPEPWSRPPQVEPLPTQPLPAQPLPALPESGEEELMWLGARQESGAAGQSEMEATPRRPAAVAAPERPDQERSDARSAPRPSVVEPRPLVLTEDELARLARDEGWDAAEVAAIRAMIGPSPTQRIELPGAEELDEAMAAFDVAPIRPQADPSREWAKAARERDEPVVHEEWAYESEPAPPSAPSQPLNLFQQPAMRRPASDPGWLRSRRGPAATAYRRLRRLFPG